MTSRKTVSLVTLTVAGALASVDPALEDAAMSCGASRFDAFRLVTLPLILPNVVSGALFAFIISFDEPVVAFFLAGIRDKTLPRMPLPTQPAVSDPFKYEDPALD